MRYAIIAVLICASLQSTVAAELQPRLATPVPGAPGTATPTPYPQVTPSTPPRAGDARPGSPLLPPIPLPAPPKDQPLPGLNPDNNKGKGD
ncbi:hypothetical protein [Pseudomonas vranovensis]|uniref:Uncharacterized protein n=1 Tax=Pseudomonas vranovensis TaxID=321661 RepID=A0A423DSY2_9PSED|nr:hypothetical protein [Pseudomonas vranovensis]ROL74814.1 hypothetical protein BHU25_11450 [Pseudomonas vranovensis]